MPASVLIAVVVESLIALTTGVVVVRVLIDPAVHIGGGPFVRVVTILVLVLAPILVAGTVRGLIGREAAARQSARFSAVLLLVVAGVFTASSFSAGAGARGVVVPALLAPPSVAMVWALSRPSATAWFTSRRPRG